MTKLKGALHSDYAGGTLAGSMIFRQGKKGSVVCGYYKPGSVQKSSPSLAQIARREAYALGIALWNSLTSEEKKYWNLLEKNGSVIV